ncbi:FecR family protein [Chondrinema litorale]|uniref:FecR family protein n=1 Tax=Chondrinema litorale TaxID=2994555 RepID=UPI002542C4AB|nr:FecR domain-containing protein [Chondrinema litorale]UZR98417.1 FecR domain-containing protein [Chondrinema litorale]
MEDFEDSNEIESLIHKQLSGEITAEEKFLLDEWLHQSVDHQKQFELLTQLWENTTLDTAAEENDQAFEYFLDKVSNVQTESIEYQSPTKTRYIWGGVAAVITLLIGVFVVYINQPQNNKELVANNTKEIEWKEYANKSGQKSKIHLPDGSVVWLNVTSSIKFPENFTENRKVVLSGEAFFDVVKDPEHPFSVQSINLTTTALGTSFNIKSFPNEKDIEVALVTGKVSIKEAEAHNEMFLNPGYKLSFNKKDKAILKASFNKEEILGWKDGVIFFDQDDFLTVLKTLERWYAVDIEVKGKIPSDFYVSGRFDGNGYLNNILVSIQYGYNFDYSIKGKQIIIDFNKKK